MLRTRRSTTGASEALHSLHYGGRQEIGVSLLLLFSVVIAHPRCVCSVTRKRLVLQDDVQGVDDAGDVTYEQ